MNDLKDCIVMYLLFSGTTLLLKFFLIVCLRIRVFMTLSQGSKLDGTFDDSIEFEVFWMRYLMDGRENILFLAVNQT